jgi:Reverse transcriptase (RNA-dependent DNA polymerase)
MDFLIAPTHIAYIKRRNIMDNVVLATEVLHQVRVKKIKGIIFKINFGKAFDRVHCDFLIKVLEGRGFSTFWINWIKYILEGNRTAINLNGQLSEYFPCKRGVRQGDSLSPFLFDLVADVFHIILHKALNNGMIKGLGNFDALG